MSATATSSARKRSRKEIRVGVVGALRGVTLAREAAEAGMRLVALCDIWEEKLREASKDWAEIGFHGE